MIQDLKPYDATRDTGVPWLGEIPTHWDVERIKNLARPGRKTFVDGDWIESPYITLNGIRLIQTGNIGVGAYREKGFRYISQETFDTLGCTEFEPADVLICRLGEPVGRACLAPDLGVRMITSVDVCMLKPREDVSSAFVVYAMSSPRYLDWVGSLVRGSTRDRVSRSMLGRFVVPVPPHPDQLAVIRFLDYAGRRIRQYIHAKTKLISLLGEQRNTIILRAVTRGIDGEAGLKDSGLDWLGEVPAHWELNRAKWYYREADERSASGSEELLSVSHITGVTPRSEKNITMFKAESYVGHKLCRSGDLVINTMWAWMGALGVAKQTGLVSPAYAVYRPHASDAFHPQFIDYLLRTSTYVAEYVRRSTGIRSSRLRLYPPQFLTMPIVRPPIGEQQAIVDAVAERTRELDRAGDSARREIGLLREYWGSLVSDVVTGKLDVREAAADLPDDLEIRGDLSAFDIEDLPADELGDIDEDLE